MANNENLKPFTSDQSHEEAVKNGRKGGKASGEARRKKADIRKALNDALNGEYTYKGVDGKKVKMTGSEMLISSMLQIASNPKNRGSVAAFNSLIKMLGQDVPDHNSDDDDQVKAFLKAMKGDADD